MKLFNITLSALLNTLFLIACCAVSELHAAAHIQPTAQPTAQPLAQHQLDDALCTAVEQGAVQEAERLLALYANPNAFAGAFGKNALHVAAAFGRSDMMRLLLGNGAIPGLTCDFNETPLHLVIEGIFVPAERMHHVASMVESLVEAGADVHQHEMMKGNTALHLIATQASVPNRYAFRIIKVLLDAGAKKDEINKKGFTAVKRAYRASNRRGNDRIGNMFASRAAFMRIYPPVTKKEKKIVAMLLQMYSVDLKVVIEAKEYLERLWEDDLHTFNLYEPYLHDDDELESLKKNC